MDPLSDVLSLLKPHAYISSGFDAGGDWAVQFGDQHKLIKCYAIVSGGTDSHLMLVDLRKKNITGKDAEILLDRAAITVNKNTIPGDPQSQFVTSGVRLGTPAVTTRGFGVEEMERVAELIDEVLVKRDDATVKRVKGQVREMVEEFPLYAKGVGVG